MDDDWQASITIIFCGRQIKLKVLQPQHIAMIDEGLSSLGEFGELHLIVEKRRIRFLLTQSSYDALKWQPGDIV